MAEIFAVRKVVENFRDRGTQGQKLGIELLAVANKEIRYLPKMYDRQIIG